MPIFSTTSSLSRRPAVSITCSGTPSTWMVWLTTSRVVPGTGVTMASSAPASALSSELLPAFGWPAITTLMPSRSSAPWRARCITPASVACSRSSWPCASAFCRKSISSSGKVQRGLDQHAQLDQGIAQLVDLARERAGQRALALRAAASVLASMRSAIASACARSILSFRKARCVNSPGSATRRCRGTGLQAARQQQLQHHRAAVRLQLQHVLAGVRVRRGEVDRQALVDGLPSARAKGR
jgi:hypothetical protein